MADSPAARPRESPSAGAGDEPEVKRRKVRKGTRSCWECKRRKIRCIFTSPADTVCDCCKRRAATCISQEFPDEPPVSGSARQVGDRLGRMEVLVEQLVKRAGGASDVPPQLPAPPPPDPVSKPESSSSSLFSSNHTGSNSAGLPTPDSSDVDGPPYLGWFGSHAGLEAEPLDQPVKPSLPAAVIAPGHGVRTVGRYDELMSGLLAAWPCQQDLDVICSFPVGTGGFLNKLVCTPYRQLFATKDLPTTESMFRLPPPGSHPALVARKLLVMALFLQGLHPSLSSPSDGIKLTVTRADLMSRLVGTAVRLVTSNDELVGSFEGAECIVLEAMYQAHAGNLRRSWLALRRAIVMAQMMGLHRGVASPCLKMLDAETREHADPEYFWFRMLCADRGLSLMLGLPAGTLCNSFKVPRDGDGDGDASGMDPMERLERMHAVIAGRILQRNETDMHDLAVTQEIDRMLQRASESMPARWWLTPTLGEAEDVTEELRETTRLLDQSYHHYLLMQLHLPFILRSKADYSKITAVDASRALLCRFSTFRAYNNVIYCCRGVDFYGATACMTLCLAHLDGHRSGSSSFLAHQRLGDRGMMEDVLVRMSQIAKTNGDALSTQSADVLMRLLAVEADAARGASSYLTHSTGCQDGGADAAAGAGDGKKNVLTLSIPYFGIIKIAREGLSRARVSDLPAAPLSAASSFSETAAAAGLPSSGLYGVSGLTGRSSGSSVPAGYQVGGQSANPDWQNVPSHYDAPRQQQGELLVHGQHHGQPGGVSSTPGATDAFGLYGGTGDEASPLLVPGLAAAADDWAFQGVDMAFFDSLTRGASMGEVMADDSFLAGFELT